MGLFSFGKNKQDNAAGGRFGRADDDALAARARAKRASSAGRRAEDPVLPEKKRARRRLVGAIALALAAAIGLPMLLDSEPKPLAGDIAIQIPSKDKAPPLPAPAAPVPAADSVDKGEEIVAAPPAAKPSAAPLPAPAAPAQLALARPDAVKADMARPADPAPVKAEPPKAEQKKPEPKPEPKHDARADAKAKAEHEAKLKAEHDAKAEAKLKAEHDAKAAEKAKAADKPKSDDKPKTGHDDSARALAILEGKAEAQKADKADAGGKVVLQVAALGSQEKAAELQARLRDAGIPAFTQKLSRPSGDLYRVKVGPVGKDEADKVRARLGKLGLSGTVVPA